MDASFFLLRFRRSTKALSRDTEETKIKGQVNDLPQIDEERRQYLPGNMPWKNTSNVPPLFMPTPNVHRVIASPWGFFVWAPPKRKQKN